MGTLFLLRYLTCLSFPNFPQSVLLVFNPRLPVVGKRKTKEKQSESMAGQIWEVEDNMGMEACYVGRKEEPSATCRWLVVMLLSQIRVLVSTLAEWHAAAFYSVLILMM